MLQSVELEKTIESPLVCKEINQSIQKEINPEYSLEGRMLQLQYFGHFWLFQKSRLIWKDPDAGKDWRQEKVMTEDKMVGWYHWLKWTWIWASSGRWWRTGKPRVLQSKGSWRVRHDLMIEQQQFFPTLYFITGTSSGYSSSLYMVNVCWWCSYKHLICKNYLVTLPTVISMIFVSFFFNWKSFHELFEYLSYWGFPGGSSS